MKDENIILQIPTEVYLLSVEFNASSDKFRATHAVAAEVVRRIYIYRISDCVVLACYRLYE